MGWLESKKVADFVKAALECSVYLAPTDYGLTDAELVEVGRLAGFQAGEIRDAYQAAGAVLAFGDPRYYPGQRALWSQFLFRQEPDFRNVAAFDFVCSQWTNIVKAEGKTNAKIDRRVVVERAVANAIPKLDIEAAIEILIIDERLVENDGVLRFARGQENHALASEQVRSLGSDRVQRDELREKAYALVKDIVARRTDDRQPQPEPLDAFAELLTALGFGPFRLWWIQIVSELRRSDPNLSPVSVAVLSAALVEGSLTFVVRRARDLKLRVFGSKDFDRPPHTWRIDELVASAASGGEAAVLDSTTRQRAEQLIRTRQRIHAGRMLQDFPDGPSDLRPEEAREAMSVAELVVRRVIDWVAKHPTPQS